jgi:hypothetical protein
MQQMDWSDLEGFRNKGWLYFGGGALRYFLAEQLLEKLQCQASH